MSLHEETIKWYKKEGESPGWASLWIEKLSCLFASFPDSMSSSSPVFDEDSKITDLPSNKFVNICIKSLHTHPIHLSLFRQDDLRGKKWTQYQSPSHFICDISIPLKFVRKLHLLHFEVILIR